MKGPRSKVQSPKSKDSAFRAPHSTLERGGVLLLVMWVTATLSAVALSLALSVRTELAATSYRLEAEQARFLARGALEQALYIVQNPGLRDAAQRPLYEQGQPYLEFSFSTGAAWVKVASESGKINVNTAPVERLQTLLLAAGVDEREAPEIAQAIGDWRLPPTSSVSSAFDLFYQRLPQPYRAAHQPFGRLEELLLVKGVTAELFYGWMERERDGRLVRRGGLNRLLTIYGSPTQVNVNQAPYEVLLTVPGLSAESARALVAGRRQKFYRSAADLPVALSPGVLGYFAFLDASFLYDLTATGRPSGTATRASVRAVVQREANRQLRLLLWQEQTTEEQVIDSLVASINESGTQ